MFELDDPFNGELRRVFEHFDLVGEMRVRNYPRERLYQWAYRFGWRVSIRQNGRDLVVTLTGGEGRETKNPYSRAVLCGRLDKLVVNGGLDTMGFTEPQIMTAIQAFTDKRFRLQALEGGGQLIVRVA